jgi:uncharacterized membrane protein YcaP (DUF421 family)
MNSYLHIILSTSAVFFFIMIVFRIFGKTELAQLSITDLVFVLLISNAVQNAMVGPDTSLLGGLIAASVLFFINMVLKRIKYRFPIFKKFMEGEPIILVYKGVINKTNCRKVGITEDEILETIREHGSDSVDEVNSVILEADGNISVVSNEYKHHSIRKIKRRKTS